MRTIARFAAAAAFGLATIACADAGDAPDDASVEAGDTMRQPTLAPAPGSDTAAAGAARIGVDSLDGGGAFLTDGEGRALYMLEGEPADSSTCYDACATEWPPFIAAGGTATADAPAVRADLIGSIARRDGQRQVTYGGHALYYYHDDEQPGETSGQDVTDRWGEWYLVTPAGDHLEEGGA